MTGGPGPLIVYSFRTTLPREALTRALRTGANIRDIQFMGDGGVFGTCTHEQFAWLAVQGYNPNQNPLPAPLQLDVPPNVAAYHPAIAQWFSDHGWQVQDRNDDDNRRLSRWTDGRSIRLGITWEVMQHSEAADVITFLNGQGAANRLQHERLLVREDGQAGGLRLSDDPPQ